MLDVVLVLDRAARYDRRGGKYIYDAFAESGRCWIGGCNCYVLSYRLSVLASMVDICGTAL